MPGSLNGRPNVLACKVVYWGPALAGRTTSLQYIRGALAPGLRRGSEVSLVIGEFRGLEVRMNLSRGPEADDDDEALPLLRGADGVVFVADSQEERVEANMFSLEKLESGLAAVGLAIDTIPLVFQYNKRDTASALLVADLETVLNPWQRLGFTAVASTGDGVLETFREIARQVFRELRRRISRSEPR